MPTPSDSTGALPLERERLTHTTCPPDDDRPRQWRAAILDRIGRTASSSTSEGGELRQPENQANEEETPAPLDGPHGQLEERKVEHEVSMEQAESTTPLIGTSPSSNGDEKAVEKIHPTAPTSSALDLQYSTRYGIQSTRLIQTHTSSMLRAGSKFRGTQQSESQKYSVEVDIKTVDMSESFICGYLRIEGPQPPPPPNPPLARPPITNPPCHHTGLTPEHATLITFFEGEIIGPKYTFQTRHPSWGASDKEDMRHWARFPAWRPLAKQARKPDFHYKNSTNRENMFMRWKEKFLVPDHKVREISGASFEGFYYICFNQVAGTINGIYFHSNASSHNNNNNNNKFQQLELKWVNDRGCFGAMEFR